MESLSGDGAIFVSGWAVQVITNKGMTEVSEVGSYLMRAAGFQAAFHQSHITESFKHLVVGHGVLSLLWIAAHAIAETVVGIAVDICIDSTFILLQVLLWRSWIREGSIRSMRSILTLAAITCDIAIPPNIRPGLTSEDIAFVTILTRKGC